MNPSTRPFAVTGTFVAALAALALAAPAAATPGDLDTAFGQGGKVTVPVGPRHARFLAAVRQPDGKLVAGGSAEQSASSPNNEDFLIVRLLPNGQLDPDFGSGGIVQVPIAAGTGLDRAGAVALGPGGTIYAAGSSDASGGDSDISMVRLTPSGGLDGSFSGDGKHTVSLASFGDSARAMAVQGDGKLVLAGTAGTAEGGFVVTRHDGSSGALDPAFNAGGPTPGMQEVVFTPGFGSDTPSGIALAGDKVVVSGTANNASTNPDFALTRLNSDGSVDTAGFGQGTGKVRSDLGMRESAAALAQDPQGRLVVAGSRHDTATATIDFLLARYNADGSPDANWSGDGFETTPVLGPDGTRFALASGVVVEPGGNVVATGRANACPQDGCAQFAAARYTDGGALDPSFGDGGTRLYDVGPGNDFAAAAVYAPAPAAARSKARQAKLQDGGEAGGVVVAGAGGDPDAGELIRVFTTEARKSHLSIKKSAHFTRRTSLPPGAIDPERNAFGVRQTYSYSISVRNDGPPEAGDGLLITDPLPSGVELVAIRGLYLPPRGPFSVFGDEVCEEIAFLNTVKCDLSSLGRIRSVQLVIDVRATAAAGPVATNTATVFSPVNGNSSATHTADITGGTDSTATGANAEGAGGTSIAIPGFDPRDLEGQSTNPVQNVLRPMAQTSARNKKLSKLARVEVAVLRKQGNRKRCQWLASTKARFKTKKKARAAKCDVGIWLRAKGTKRWKFRMKRRLPPGSYTLYSRAVNKAGVFETTFSKKDKNLRSFKVRKRR